LISILVSLVLSELQMKCQHNLLLATHLLLLATVTMMWMQQ
jgi:hypothetical protein